MKNNCDVKKSELGQERALGQIANKEHNKRKKQVEERGRDTDEGREKRTTSVEGVKGDSWEKGDPGQERKWKSAEEKAEQFGFEGGEEMMKIEVVSNSDTGVRECLQELDQNRMCGLRECLEHMGKERKGSWKRKSE